MLDTVFLEAEEEFIEDIESMVSEVTNYEDNAPSFKCAYCSELGKRKRGLSRHVKHAALKEGSSTPIVDEQPSKSEEIHSKLNGIVECAEKISDDLCFPEDFRSNFCKENFSISVEETDNLWQSIRLLNT